MRSSSASLCNCPAFFLHEDEACTTLCGIFFVQSMGQSQACKSSDQSKQDRSQSGKGHQHHFGSGRRNYQGMVLDFLTAMLVLLAREPHRWKHRPGLICDTVLKTPLLDCALPKLECWRLTTRLPAFLNTRACPGVLCLHLRQTIWCHDADILIMR